MTLHSRTLCADWQKSDSCNGEPEGLFQAFGQRSAARRKRKPRSQGSLLPALRREREGALSRSAGRAGENPGNEVEVESEKKIKEEKRAREREGNLPSLSPPPHPLVVVVVFFCLHLFSPSPPLGYLWPHEPVTDLSMANFNGQACHDISLVAVRSCRWSRACIVPQQHLIVCEGVYLFIYAHEVKDTDCIAQLMQKNTIQATVSRIGPVMPLSLPNFCMPLPSLAIS